MQPLIGAVGLTGAKVGRLQSFLPATDSGNLDDRGTHTGFFSPLEYSTPEDGSARPNWPAAMHRDQSKPIATSPERSRWTHLCGHWQAQRPANAAPSEIAARNCAKKWRSLVGAEYTVLDDLNNGARKSRSKFDFYRFPDSRKLTGDHQCLHGASCATIQGCSGCGPIREQDPQERAARSRLNRGLANSAGHLRPTTRHRRCGWPLRALKWVTG